MPYITKKQRERIDAGITPKFSGELNYQLTKNILDYLDNKFDVGYADYNEVMGVLSCIQHELYRRRIAPYEEKKARAAGDVF